MEVETLVESWGTNKATSFPHGWAGFEALKRHIDNLKKEKGTLAYNFALPDVNAIWHKQ